MAPIAVPTTGVPLGERLDRRHAEALVSGRRQNEEVSGLVPVRQARVVGNRAHEEDALGDAELGGDLGELRGRASPLRRRRA